MRIHHMIGGKSVESSSYFETVDPATRAVLAAVGSGGQAEVDAEVDAAVDAAKAAFPKWARLAATGREA